MTTIMKATRFLRKKQKKKDKVPFKVGNLIFESREDYELYKYIDDNISIVDKCIEDDLISASHYFSLIEDIRVIQTFWSGEQELYELFPNAADLIFFVDDDMYDSNVNEIGSFFFHKIHLMDEKVKRKNKIEIKRIKLTN